MIYLILRRHWYDIKFKNVVQFDLKECYYTLFKIFKKKLCSWEYETCQVAVKLWAFTLLNVW